MIQKLIAANWKENPKSEKQAVALFRATASIKYSKDAEVLVCPPFIYLEKIAEIKKRSKNNIALGAQDVFWEEKGAYTGGVGPKMLRSLGVQYVIVGHSERRKWFKETDVMINKKIKLAFLDGLKVILCVGESPVVRKRGIAAAKKFVEGQLSAGLKGIKKIKTGHLTVAYEPIWAIGTGRYDEPEDAVAMADFIKISLKKARHSGVRVLYGGSVNGENARDYVHFKSIDGALVGGASLKAQEFKKIINAVSGKQ